MTVTEIREHLQNLSDKTYRDFVIKLTPALDKNKVLGVRAPELRKLAKQLTKSGEYRNFLKDIPHQFHEENNLHAYIIGEIKDFNSGIAELRCFLPFVDNWATCDSLRPTIKKASKSQFLSYVYECLKSEETYTVRFGIEMLMVHFLSGDFKPEYASRVSAIKSDEYYVNMMIAWYFATALAKNTSEILPYFERKVLSPSVHNKAIQKSVESFRISTELKDHLRTLRIK